MFSVIISQYFPSYLKLRRTLRFFGTSINKHFLLSHSLRRHTHICPRLIDVLDHTRACADLAARHYSNSVNNCCPHTEIAFISDMHITHGSSIGHHIHEISHHGIMAQHSAHIEDTMLPDMRVDCHYTIGRNNGSFPFFLVDQLNIFNNFAAETTASAD